MNGLSMEVTVILIALGAVVLLAVLAMLVNLFRAMTRFALAVCIVAGLCVVGLIVLTSLRWPVIPGPAVLPAGDPAPSPAVPADSGPSAATSITLFLLAVVVFLGLAMGGAVLGWQWWKQRQKRQRLEAMALVYGAMNGALPAPRRAGARLGQGQSNIYVMGDRHPQPQPEPLPGWEVQR